MDYEAANRIAEMMKSGFAAREQSLRRCARFGYPVWDKSSYGGYGKAADSTVLVPPQESLIAAYAWRAASSIYSSTVGVGQTFFRFEMDGATSEESFDARQAAGATLPLMRLLFETNFAAEYQAALLDMVVVGNGIMYADFNPERRRIEFQSFSLLDGCYFWSTASGRPDQFCRYFTLSVKQAVQKYGEACGPRVMELYRNGSFDEKLTFFWLIYPRALYGEKVAKRKPGDDRPIPAKEMPYGSVVCLENERLVVEQSGYERFPIAVGLWGRVSGSIYGWSPIEMAMPDIEYLMRLKFRLMQCIERQSDPALIIPFSWDGFSADAGTYNFIEATSGPVKDQYGLVAPQTQLPDIRDQQQRCEQSIARCFLLDQFEALNEYSKTMSATEAQGRIGQSVRAVAPMAHSVHEELLGVVLQRVLDIAIREKLLPEQVISGLDADRIRIKYVSVLNNMVLESEASKMTNYFQSVLQYEQTKAAGGTEFEARYDSDAVVHYLTDFYNVPSGIVRTASEQDKRRQELAEQQQQAQQQALEAEVLSKANPQQPSAQGSFAQQRGF